MNPKPQIVIFSSGEQKETITRLASVLSQYNCECTLWTELFTRKNEDLKFALLPALLKKIPTFDFAIILATPDEMITRKRNGVVEEYAAMRDNVIFEIGLCVMALGCNRTIILQHKDVYLFDDLIGVSGIGTETPLLSASALGIKCLSYSSGEEFEKLFIDIAQYINVEYEVFSPIVIGAACSTAIGYFNMFIKRMALLLKDYPMGMNKELRILIPEYITGTIFEDIKEYYKGNQYEPIVIPAVKGRDIASYYKMEGDTMIVCDIPTSIGASYQTAKDILSVDAADLKDVNAEIRFLKKEANMFYLTIKKMMAINVLPENIQIRIEVIRLADI